MPLEAAHFREFSLQREDKQRTINDKSINAGILRCAQNDNQISEGWEGTECGFFDTVEELGRDVI
jgi:hypothetical protein